MHDINEPKKNIRIQLIIFTLKSIFLSLIKMPNKKCGRARNINILRIVIVLDNFPKGIIFFINLSSESSPKNKWPKKLKQIKKIKNFSFTKRFLFFRINKYIIIYIYKSKQMP